MNGKNVIISQNTDQSILELRAQKYLYSFAKFLFVIRVIFVVTIPIVITILVLVFPSLEDVLGYIFSFYFVLALLAGIAIDEWIKRLKKTAASIQEKFDCRVLDIPWNGVLLKNQPQHEIIFRNSSKFKGDVTKLKDWYSLQVEELSTNLVTLVCQRTNCTYDFSFRKNYAIALVLLNLLVGGILLAFAYYSGSTLADLVVFVFLPILPLLLVIVQEIMQNKEAMNNLGEIRDMIEGVLKAAKMDTIIEHDFIRKLQDRIYNSRVLSPLLPDWVFDFLRPKLEAQMNYGVSEIIRMLKNNN